MPVFEFMCARMLVYHSPPVSVFNSQQRAFFEVTRWPSRLWAKHVSIEALGKLFAIQSSSSKQQDGGLLNW